jgi:broad specificity phosphatase PhoE
MRLYVVRHGESVDDIEDCYGGIADFPLTARGQGQAREVGSQLAGEGIQAIYSSPLARAHECAQIIAEQIPGEVPVKVIRELQERNSYGVLSGVNKQRANEIFRHILSELKEPPGYSREPLVGAEDFDAFLQRVEQTCSTVINDARSMSWQRIAIVTHGKFTQALFEHVFRLQEEVDLKLSAVNVIDYEPARAVLIRR